MVFDLILAFIICQTLWRAIIKPGVYPVTVKWYLKWIHAFVMLGVCLNVLGAINEGFFLVRYRSDLIRSFSSGSTVFGSPMVGIAYIVYCVSGLYLWWVSIKMSKREESAVPLFLTLITVNIFTFIYIIFAKSNDEHPLAAKVLLVSAVLVIYFTCVVFYLNNHVRKYLFSSK
jgi:hypothetical protein